MLLCSWQQPQVTYFYKAGVKGQKMSFLKVSKIIFVYLQSSQYQVLHFLSAYILTHTLEEKHWNFCQIANYFSQPVATYLISKEQPRP